MFELAEQRRSWISVSCVRMHLAIARDRWTPFVFWGSKDVGRKNWERAIAGRIDCS